MKSQEPATSPPTAWHPLFGWVLRAILPKDRSQIHAEFQLNLLPLRNDYVVIQSTPGSPLLSSGPLSTITQYFGWFTVLELTGPTSSLRREDWLYSLGSTHLFCAAQGIFNPKHAHIIRIASRLTAPFIDQAHAYQGEFVTLAKGIHQVTGQPHPTFCIETDLVEEPLLRLFSPLFLKDPKAVFDLLTQEERAIFYQVYREIEQFKADPQAALKYADYEVFQMSMQEMVASFLKSLPAEEVLRHYNAEERLRGLPAEERLRGLPVEERLRGLPAKDRLKGLDVQDIASLSEEEREHLRRLLASQEKGEA